ncbi:MAG: hypothetical protein LUF35_07170 [Lachnospiraceae bacterium]|nr:hypothetical protein [Lachnospiraceae bacterium]
MNREELIGRLSDLQNYHTVTKQICEYLNLDLLRNDYVYNAGNDSRVSTLLEYMSPTEADFSKYIDYTAFAIVANIARFNMPVPTDDEMLQMLEISGYSAEEMKRYVQFGRPQKAPCISSTHLVPSVCLLSRVLADAMMDKSEWQGYRKGKKRKNYTSGTNPSMQKLQKLVEYMDRNDLLFLDSSNGEDYTEFVCNHSRYICRFSCIHEELKSVSDAVKHKQREFAKEAKREMERLKKKKTKGNLKNAQNGSSARTDSAKLAPLAPLAVPAASMKDLPSIQEISSSIQPSRSYLSRSSEMDLEHIRDIPPEMDALVKEMEQFDNELGIWQEECWAICDRLTEENTAERMEYVSDEFIPNVAMGLFQAIRDGDEIYKLRVGRVVMEDLMSMSEMPLPCGFDTGLDDEGDWDYAFTECNGKLALPVIREGDCISLPLNAKEEALHYTVPVTAVISRFAGRPFEAPLYIRKSLIKKFKENGCSDRKARDYAVIIATLVQVNLLCEEDDPFASEYPKPGETKVEEPSEKTLDARLEKEIAARQEAEHALRQAQKENQVCRHEISMLQREIDRLRNRLAENEKGREKNGDGGEEEEAAGKAAAETVQYPYRTKLRVVLYGGFDVFHRELLKLLPDVRVVEISAHIDVNPIRNADIVFLQINKTDHSGYWTVCDACKNSQVPYIHLNYASAKRCAGVMVEEIKKLQGDTTP